MNNVSYYRNFRRGCGVTIDGFYLEGNYYGIGIYSERRS